MNLSTLTASDFKHISALIDRKASLRSQIQEIDAELSDFGSIPPTQQKAAAVVAFRKPNRPGKHGGLKDAILNLLQSAGKDGISVKEIAAKTKRNPANIYTWFFTTGKNVKEIKKVSGGTYSWVG